MSFMFYVMKYIVHGRNHQNDSQLTLERVVCLKFTIMFYVVLKLKAHDSGLSTLFFYFLISLKSNVTTAYEMTEEDLASEHLKIKVMKILIFTFLHKN